jgi:CRISPR-associated endonuclease/helicase Cas3
MTIHLTVQRFAEFFAALNDGHAPFAWQTRLCEQVMFSGRWPDVIDAPTGSGKSSVVDVHVFAVAAMATGGERVPRRLVMAVDRRALVDRHHEHAGAIANALGESRDGILAEVGAALRSLRSWCSVDEPGEAAPFVVGVLRGGRRPSRDWLDDPAACQVIAATPEMWGSRLLFRGYGTTDAARPREAGLLAYDSVAVLDEAHLNRQLLTTARRVHDHVAAHALALGLAPLQVVEMSATSSGSQDKVAVGVTAGDIDADPVLSGRLTRPKPVLIHETLALPATSTAANVRAAAEVFVKEILTMAAEVDGTIGCVVNTVRLAVAITEQLKSATLPESHAVRGGGRPTLLQLVGRMRSYDVARIRREHPRLFQQDSDPVIDVLVATQTIEVGLDMDFGGLITELAPGSAIAQRAGRLNRSGRRPSAPCVVIAPEATLDATSKGIAPYRWDDLEAARGWLHERADDATGLAPWTLHPRGGGATPPPAGLHRPVLHRPEWWNIDLWARTSQALFAPINLDLWLQDDLDADQSVSVVIRQGQPHEGPSAIQQLRDAPPRPHELFPATLDDAKKVLDRTTVAYVIRGDEAFHWNGELADSNATDDDRRQHQTLRPGDVVVFNADTPTFTEYVFDPEGSDRATDVAELPGSSEAGRADFRFGLETPLVRELPNGKTFIEDLRVIVASAADPEDVSSLVVQHLRAEAEIAAGGARWELFHELIEASPNDKLLVSIASGGTEPADFWLIVSATARIASDDELRQLSSPRRAVTLDAHQHAVGNSAACLAEVVGLKRFLIDAVNAAGSLHDEGKADPRFQRALRPHGNASLGLTLAKSGMHDLGLIRRARAASGLPQGWRHEQLSAAIAWGRLRDHPSPEHRDLVTRLTGTSHGHGRPLFDDGESSLAHDVGESRSAAARELYGQAEWDELIDRTHVHWGYWGTAYLEAILRAADVTVSRRGS